MKIWDVRKSLLLRNAMAILSLVLVLVQYIDATNEQEWKYTVQIKKNRKQSKTLIALSQRNTSPYTNFIRIHCLRGGFGGRQGQPPPPQETPAAEAPEERKARANGLALSFAQRSLSAAVLATLFGLILRVTRQTGCAILLIGLQVGMYREVVDIISDPENERELPTFHREKYLWLFSFVQFIYGKILEHEIMEVARPMIANNFHAVHNMLSYVLWITIVLRFVLSMQKSTLYRYQISQLAGCLLGIIVLVVQSCMGLANLRAGLFWFVLPVLLVIINDSTAYMFGITMGRTPLIQLSPKKTREGFVGGLFATAVASFFLAGFLGRQHWLICPRNLLPGPVGTCIETGLYLKAPLGERAGGLLGKILPASLAKLRVMPVQVHAIWFSLFASLIAPFHGFLASAVKRAYNVKDFGDSIPGHGGIIDRMDCQVMMIGFAYMYLQSFLPDLLDHSR